MAQASQVLLNPRKSPVQARSAATVEAILDATIQVLLHVGKERLTTTRVALRAGVSIGTLYQYFPNKKAMLQAALRRHLNSVSQAVERVCREQQGHSLGEMAAALVNAFLDVKMKDAKTSAALYSVSSDVDGFKISREVNLRANDQIAEMLASARDGLAHDPQIIASMVQATLNGVSRRVLESEEPARGFAEIRNELIFFVTAYLDACSSRAQSSALKNGKS